MKRFLVFLMLLLPITSTAAEVTILNDGFEGVFTSPPWTSKYSGLGYTFGQSTCRASTGQASLWCAALRYGVNMGLDACTKSYPNNMGGWAIAGPFDLRDATRATVTFDYWLKSNGNGTDFLWFGAKDKASANFYIGDQRSGGNGEWVKDATFTLAAFTGKPEVWIGFAFYSDGWGSPSGLPNGAFIDNVRVTKETATSCDLVMVDVETKVIPETGMIEARALIQNVGTVASPATTCSFYIAHQPITNVPIPAMGPGDTLYTGWQVIPFAVQAWVDPFNLVIESNEANNTVEGW